MTSPQFPGQSGLGRLQQQQREQMRRMEEQRRMGAAWSASQRTIDDSQPGLRTQEPARSRPGLIRRFVRTVLALALAYAAFVAGALGYEAYELEELGGAALGGAGALLLLVMAGRALRWGDR